MILRSIVSVGILDRLGLSKQRLDVLYSPIDVGASPFQENSLTQVVLSELFDGVDTPGAWPMDRESAMTVPAVAKARNLLVSSIAKFPLVALRAPRAGDPVDEHGVPIPVPADPQPTWLYRTNGAVSPYERMVWTVDDGFFHGVSLWLTDRGTDGRITDAAYCPFNDWRIQDNKILVADSPVDEGSVLLFNFSTYGILVEGRKTLGGARDTERAWTGRMRNPIPLIELRVTDDTNLEQTEVDKYVDAWAKARKQENGAVSFTPPGMEIHTHGEVSADLYIENRNAIRTDVGSFANVRASMLDGTAGIDSLTYSTTEGERNSFYEFDLPFWMDPIQARLSQDDIVPRGTRVRFDKYESYAAVPTPTDAPVKD